VFSLEAASTAICLLIQLEKHVTEEAGITPSVYTRKEPVSSSTSTIYAPTHIKLPSISYSAYFHLVYCILIYTMHWELMKLAGSHVNSSLLFMMKMMV
jgi:hypothetical protein